MVVPRCKECKALMFFKMPILDIDWTPDAPVCSQNKYRSISNEDFKTSPKWCPKRQAQ